MSDYRAAGLTTAEVLSGLGHPFAVFDERTQDSGHISYGIEGADGARHFVKTAGTRALSPGGTTHADRVETLRQAARIHEDVAHAALIDLHEVIDTSDGVVVVYEWFDGALLGCPQSRRQDPTEAHNRFKSLAASEIASALASVTDLHVQLERAGWVGGDFYDGCLMYDFPAGRIKVIDFECYRRGPYLNDQGRLPGSTRFMAPEELVLGARIDSRTTVFNLGRMIELFLLARHDLPQVRSLVDHATAATPDARPATVERLHAMWQSVRPTEAAERLRS